MELLNYARGNFCGMWVFAYSWGCCFVDAPVFSFSKKDNSSKFVFVENVNSLGRATQEYHENWATANSNDFTVLVIWKSEVLNMCEYALSEEKNTKFSNTLWQHLFFFYQKDASIIHSSMNSIAIDLIFMLTSNILVSSTQFWIKC